MATTAALTVEKQLILGQWFLILSSPTKSIPFEELGLPANNNIKRVVADIHDANLIAEYEKGVVAPYANCISHAVTPQTHCGKITKIDYYDAKPWMLSICPKDSSMKGCNLFFRSKKEAEKGLTELGLTVC